MSMGSGLLHFIFLMFLLFSGWQAASQSAMTTINEQYAREAFNQGDFLTALDIWNQLYDQGNTDPNLLLNIGHAYSMLDSTSYAILFYEKALRFKPGNKDIQLAIENERSRMPDTVEPLKQFILIRWVKLVLVIFKPGIWAIFGLLLLLVALLQWFSLLGLIKEKLLLPAVNSWLLVFSGILFLIIAFFAYRQIYKTDEAIILSSCESRQGPSEQSPIVRTLHPGEKVILTDTINDWYKVNLLNLDEAWIKKECAVIIDLHPIRNN